jgi:hypothetical protein
VSLQRGDHSRRHAFEEANLESRLAFKKLSLEEEKPSRI